MRKCPSCGHQGARRSHRFPSEKLTTLVLPVRPYRCKSCNHRFWWMSIDPSWRRLGRQGLIGLSMILVVAIGLVYVTNLPERKTEPVATSPRAQRAELPPTGTGPDPSATASPGNAVAEPTTTGPDSPAAQPAPPTPTTTAPPTTEPTTAPGWVAPERPTDPLLPEMLGLRVATQGNALVVEILTDERPRHWEIYPIDRRLVIDLQGPWRARRLVAPPIDHPLFARARIGQHQDLVRIVIDLSREAEVTSQATPRDDALVVELESAEAPADG